MEAGGKDCEEETLQTAFKKLRVDAGSLSGAESVSDTLTPGAASRVSLDGGGAKVKLGGPKDTWHCCTRKPSRASSSRSQRRRRSKSPILHPPRFTYCSGAASALAPPGGGPKQQRLAASDPAEPQPAAEDVPAPVRTERRPSPAPGRGSPVVFGVSPSYDARLGGVSSSCSAPDVAPAQPRWEGSSGDAVSCPENGAGAAAPLRSDAADFRALSQLAEGGPAPCRCCHGDAAGDSKESAPDGGRGCSCGARWSGVEVYSFTGLRGAIQEDEARTLSGSSAPSPLSAGSPRSCSEQARAYVDDITIEDLSGYMEYYLYIPKKMSHMAEMMYT